MHTTHRSKLLVLLALSAPLQAQNLLATEFELKDGAIQDTAAHHDATSGPSNKRIWLAQGRVRAALDLQAAQRMAGEDRYFDGVAPQLLPTTPGATSGWEKVLQVELDEANAKLYTLTETTLYREDVSNPSAPVFEAALSLASLPAGSGDGECLRVWSATQTVVLLTHTNIVTLSSNTSGLSVLGSTQQSLPFVDSLVPGSPNSITPSQVTRLARMQLAQDVDGRVIAYVIGQAAGYGLIRPGPGVLVLADLGLASGFTTPTFDNVPNPLLEGFVFFDPARLPGAAAPYSDWGARDVAVVPEIVAGVPQQSVFLACGKLAQIQRLDATSAWTNGMNQLTPQLNVDLAGHDVQRVVAHPLDSGKLLATTLYGELWLVDRATGQKHGSAPEIFRGVFGDVEPVVRTGAQPTHWSSSSDGDYQLKVTDVTQPSSSGAPLTQVLERFWPFASDGGVYISDYDSIYLMTFGSLVRYQRQGADWVPDLSSVQPANVGLGVNTPGATEHIFLMRDVDYPGDHRLYVATARGGFCEFKVDPFTYNPLPPSAVDGPALSSISSSWIDGEPSFGNDVTAVRIAGTLWVLTDLALLRSPASEAVLIAHRRNASGVWERVAWAVFPTATTGALFANTDVIHVTNDTTPLAFVNHPQGFVSIPLSTLANSTPSISFADSVDTYLGGAGFKLCKGIASRRNRVFVCLSSPGASGAAVNSQVSMYSYSASTGMVGPLLQALTDRDLYCQSNGAIGATNITSPPVTCAPTTAPVATFGRSFRARFHAQTSTCGALYVCAEPLLLELGYNTTADALSYAGHWVGDYAGAIQDANRYDFGSGLRLLVVKDTESFALVTPTTLSCP